jgi:signal transduction histidine kinase
LDSSGRIVRLIAGYPEYVSSDRVEGKHVREILEPEDAARIEAGLRDLWAHRKPVTIEYAVQRADGLRHLEARVVLFGENEAIAVLRDVSDRHHAEEALRQTEERLRASQKMEAIGRLAGGVAHDFNNLLTIMLSCADLLARSIPPGSLTSAYITDLYGAAERGAALTRQLLAFSHRQPLQLRVFELNSVVSELKSMLGRLIGENIQLVTRLDPRTGFVRADRGQVEQVIVNLVVNARDALGERGGQIVLATAARSAEEAGDAAGEPNEGGYAVLIVKDDGMGMTDEVKAHLFEPFFTTKARGKGTGLGLATVYGIAKQSGGRVHVRSAPGEGAELEVLFPAVSPEAAERRAATVPAKRPSGHERVLLVDDEAPLRRVVGEILLESGYRVELAASAEEALAKCEAWAAHEETIDLLLTDVVMPGMSGHELATRVRRLLRVPVLFMSGYEEHSGLGGGDPMIRKPFTASGLARRVREVLDAGSRPSQRPSVREAGD